MPSVSRRASPAFVPPLRPSLTGTPPAGDGWLHEIKHDGYRTLLVLHDGMASAYTMNGPDWSNRYARPLHRPPRCCPVTLLSSTATRW